jgi:YD repeat-containing protein
MRSIEKIGTICALAFLVSCDNQTSSNVQTPDTEKIDKTNAQNLKSDLQELGLNGKVKALKQEEFYKGTSESEIGLKTGSNSFSYKFNEIGTKTEEQYYDSIGMIKFKSEYIYSSGGQKSGKKITDLDNKLLHSYKYEYDELGRVIKINITDNEDNDKFEYYSTSKYDENSNEILTITYTPDGKKIQTTECIFENNQEVKVLLYDNMDTPYAICEYKYNEKCDVNKEIYYTGNNLLFEEYSITYTYDSQNNWIKKVYSLDKKHMNSSSNASRIIGIQTITMRTITYY